MKEALRRIFILSAVLFLLLLPPGAEGAGLSVAVQPFLSQGTEFHLGPAVSEIVSTSLAGARDITVVERMRLAEVARQHRLSMSGVVDTATAAKAGKLSGARYFILGAVSRFGALLVVTARLVDVESGRFSGASNSLHGRERTRSSLSRETSRRSFWPFSAEMPLRRAIL